MSKWPAWVQAELDAGRISEEELDGWRVSLYGASWPDVGRPFIDIEPDALCLIGAGLVSAKRSESFREAFDYANNIIAALSGQPTAEVERLKQRVGELEGLLRGLLDGCDAYFDDLDNEPTLMSAMKKASRSLCGVQIHPPTDAGGEGV